MYITREEEKLLRDFLSQVSVYKAFRENSFLTPKRFALAASIMNKLNIDEK